MQKYTYLTYKLFPELMMSTNLVKLFKQLLYELQAFWCSYSHFYRLHDVAKTV